MRDRKPEPPSLRNQVELQPFRHALRQRRDDDLVVAAEVDGVLDRHQRLGIAEAARDPTAGGVRQLRQRLFEDARRLVLARVLRVDDAMHSVSMTWNDEVEPGWTPFRALVDRIKERRG